MKKKNGDPDFRDNPDLKNRVGGIYSGNAPYVNPTPGELPILCWGPFPDGLSIVESNKGLIEDLFDSVRECGFNFWTVYASTKELTYIMQLFANDSMKIMLRNNNLLSVGTIGKFVNTFKDYKDLAGWFVKDEPEYEEILDFAKCSEEIYKYDPKHMVYINLKVEVYCPDDKSYECNDGSEGDDETDKEKEPVPINDFLLYVQQNLKPAVWSYDFYPIIEKNSGIIVKDEFYYYLENFSKMSKNTSRPFWAFCQCLSIKYTNKSWWYPVAKREYILFEAFSALAYGAQGIVYWSYGLRKPSGTSIYTMAPVKMSDDNTRIVRTEVYDIVKEVNKEIRKYSHIFLGCELIECKHTGDKVWKGTTKLNFFQSFGPIRMIKTESSGVLVSLLKNGNRNYVVIVNHDVLNSQTVDLTFKDTEKSWLIKTDGFGSQLNPHNYKFSIDPGSYAIFEYGFFAGS